MVPSLLAKNHLADGHFGRKKAGLIWVCSPINCWPNKEAMTVVNKFQVGQNIELAKILSWPNIELART
jgi:hypothetical protein